MSPERWHQIKTIFEEAIGRAPEGRRFVASAAGDDEELRRRVEAMLDAHEAKASGRDPWNQHRADSRSRVDRRRSPRRVPRGRPDE